MKQTILKRLAILEKRPAKLKAHDQTAYEQRTLDQLGMTREDFLKMFGSFPNWAYMQMTNAGYATPKAIPPQYQDAKDYYFALIQQKS